VLFQCNNCFGRTLIQAVFASLVLPVQLVPPISKIILSPESSVLCPGTTLFDAPAVIALFFVVGELVKQLAGKVAAESAMLKLLAFAAGFYRALIAPERFGNFYAAFAVHLFAVFTGIAQNSTS